jgi:hypothetical protein
VRLYNGQLKHRQDVHEAVVDIDAGNRDLQQCADAVIRLRAEYLYSLGQYDSIGFRFTNGTPALFQNWRRGQRPAVSGNKVRWVASAPADSSHASLRRYLDSVFQYAGSYSLSKELTPEADRMQTGDIFIQGGFPGHAVIVVDAARCDNGETKFLLAQSYMPAQEIHVLKNPAAESPWYALRTEGDLVTPEWTFQWKDRRRFP